MTAYHGHVASVLRYGVIFWGNSTDKLKVFIAQKRCIKAMKHLKQTDSCREYFTSLKILTLPSLYIIEVAMFVRSNLNLFTMYPTGSRREGCLCHRSSKTRLMRISVLCMAPIIYNKIPITIRNKPSHTEFKHALNQLLIEKAYYTVDEFLKDISFA